jgi:CheY-like chemotaxis protein
MRVMVVEDDDDFLRAFDWRMRRSTPDVEIVHVPTPADGIRRIVEGEAFDVVVTDLMFRGCSSGEDVMAAAQTHEIPALLCSDLLEMFGPDGMVRKVHLLKNPIEYISALLARAPGRGPDCEAPA